LINSDRFRHRLSIEYARLTRSGSRVFHASSAARTFKVAVSRVNGGVMGLVTTDDMNAPFDRKNLAYRLIRPKLTFSLG